MNPFKLVFEVKERSPFSGWVSPLSRYQMLRIAQQADIVSIHTNELWGGSWGWLEEARRLLPDKLILAKGMHPTIFDVRRAIDCGADYVLTVGWAPEGSESEKCWHEISSLSDIASSPADVVVCNSRCPRTGNKTPFTIEHAVAVNKRRKLICQASHIRLPSDIHPAVNYALIGEALYKEEKIPRVLLEHYQYDSRRC